MLYPPMRHVPVSLVLCALLAAAGMAAHASPFYAPPAPAEDTQRFTGDAELGYTHLSGNTDSQTLIAKGRLSWLTGNWLHTLRGETRHVSRSKDTSAEQYLLAARERYDLEGPHYIFGFARWEKDRFSGYDHQLTSIAGYGREVLDDERHRLSMEAGPGLRHDRFNEGESETLGVAYGALSYRWDLSETANINQELSVEGTDESVTSRSLSSLSTRLNAHLALKLSHEVKHNSQPPESADSRTDHITSASLLYSW